jgi:PKD repeat protein
MPKFNKPWHGCCKTKVSLKNANMKKILSLLLLSILILGSKKISAQCAANFSLNQGINGLVNFTDLSTGPIAYWNWNFGEPQSGVNNQSWLQNPSHTYQSNGVYTIVLSVGTQTNGGCTSSVAVVFTVTSSPCNLPIFANFTGTTGLAGSYSVTSVTTGTTGAATYSWNWGDGTSSAGPNAVHTYSANNAYNVTLFVTDGACMDSIDQNVWISTVGCSLVANYVSQNGINGVVDFTSTTTGTTPSTYYVWNFGDGTTGSGSLTTHTYLNNGNYLVQLTAALPNGTMNPVCFSTFTTVIAVTNATCNLYSSYTYTNNANNYTVTSTSTGTNLGSTYLWDWDDGNSSTGATAAHSYTANGWYNVKLVVSNGGNCIDSTTQSIMVNSICNLTASIVANNFSGGNWSFYAMSQNQNTVGVTAAWNFGNGNTGNGGWVTQTYSTTGIYTVILTLTDPNIFPVCQATAMTVINVTCSLGGSFSHSVLPGGVVNYVSTSTGTSLGTTFNWNYGDGTTGSGPTSSHTYSNGGLHYAGLFLYDSPTCVDTLWDSVNVNTIPCIANSNFSVLYSGTPLYWNAVPAYFGNVWAAFWAWGDGSFDSALYPSHTYSAAGLYNICLTVTTSCGSSSTTCTNYNIYKMSAPVNVDQQMVHISVMPNNAVGLAKLTMENAVVSIYPIPSSGKIELKVFDLLSSSKAANASVIDMLGREVHKEEIQVTNGRIDSELDLQYLNNGTYFIKVRSAERTYTSKIVISH